MSTVLCCELFSEMINEAGKKGFAFIPKNIEPGQYIIFLQSRNQDTDDITDKLTVIQQAVRYCPFCGTELQQVIQKNKVLIEALFEKNKRFLL